MAEIENKQSWNNAVNKYIDVHIVHITPHDWLLLKQGNYRAARHGKGEIRDIWFSVFDLTEAEDINHVRDFDNLIEKGFSFAFVSLIQVCMTRKIYGIHFHDMCLPIDGLDYFLSEWVETDEKGIFIQDYDE